MTIYFELYSIIKVPHGKECIPSIEDSYNNY